LSTANYYPEKGASPSILRVWPDNWDNLLAKIGKWAEKVSASLTADSEPHWEQHLHRHRTERAPTSPVIRYDTNILALCRRISKADGQHPKNSGCDTNCSETFGRSEIKIHTQTALYMPWASRETTTLLTGLSPFLFLYPPLPFVCARASRSATNNGAAATCCVRSRARRRRWKKSSHTLPKKSVAKHRQYIERACTPGLAALSKHKSRTDTPAGAPT